MTTDRELLQQAFDALNDALVYLPPNIHAENVALFAVNSLRARLAQQEQEPVAWLYLEDLERFKTNETYANAYSIKVSSPDKGETVPLYTAPQPAQKPLTDEQIRKIVYDGYDIHEMDVYGFARAIEAAHNIKEPK